MQSGFGCVGTITLLDGDKILWSLFVDHQLFALTKLDVTVCVYFRVFFYFGLSSEEFFNCVNCKINYFNCAFVAVFMHVLVALRVEAVLLLTISTGISKQRKP